MAEDLAKRLQGLKALKRPEARTPTFSQPNWVVPLNGMPGVKTYASNNNVSIAEHEGRLYMAWRTAPSHFASDKTLMHVVSSKDGGKTWGLETTIDLGTDVREPTLVSFNGELSLYYVELGKNSLAFEPHGTWRMTRGKDGEWSERSSVLEVGEMPWEIKVRNGKLWMTSYKGSHYDMGPSSEINLNFKTSSDGIHWEPAQDGRGTVYSGGVSEAGFEFDEDGNLWAVTRNEDGDKSGFGSHLAFAPAGKPGEWKFPSKSDPERYDSPRMFRHGKDIYLVARRDVGGPFDKGLRMMPFAAQKISYMASYAARPKRTALYRIDTQTKKVVWVQDLPSAGDTAFPSIVQTGPDTFVIANYTSPLAHADWPWLRGQLDDEGTQIYLQTLTFR